MGEEAKPKIAISQTQSRPVDDMTAAAQVKYTVVKRILKTLKFENLTLILVGKSMGEDISMTVE